MIDVKCNCLYDVCWTWKRQLALCGFPEKISTSPGQNSEKDVNSINEDRSFCPDPLFRFAGLFFLPRDYTDGWFYSH